MEKIKAHCIIVGAGTYGQVYAKYLSESYSVVGFIDDKAELRGKIVDGIKVLGNIDFLYHYLENNKDTAVFVPIGNNPVRVKLLTQLNAKGYNTPSFIHKNTIIHNSVVFGKAVYILPASNIMPSTVVGDYVMISMGVNIAHHVTIANGCFFSQGANIGASIAIGDNAYFGIASTVMTGIKSVGSNALIGAGTLIIKDVDDNAVMIGNPGKFLRNNN